jgi:hypothetical protein
MRFHVSLLCTLLVLSAQPSLGLAMMRMPNPGEPTAQTGDNPKNPPKDQAANKRIKIQTVPGPAKTKTPAR